MTRPAVLGLDELKEELAAAGGGAHVHALPRFRSLAEEELGVPSVDSLDDLPERATTLVVLGGGALIDEAKLWRHHTRPELRLVAIPSVWGSGAEASPIVALSRREGKLIEMDEALLPDARAVWPELAASLPEERAREACGDTWAHALEGFLSPLASDELRTEIAGLLSELLALPLGNDPAWFERSAAACAAQARSSVGLVHGIAHVVEGPLAHALEPAERPYGHARLTSLFLLPVLALNRSLSPKFDDLTAAHGLDGERVLAVAEELFDGPGYARVLPVLEEHWRDVLRDRCTRTNSALVRPQHLLFFLEERFR